MKIMAVKKGSPHYIDGFTMLNANPKIIYANLRYTNLHFAMVRIAHILVISLQRGG